MLKRLIAFATVMLFSLFLSRTPIQASPEEAVREDFPYGCISPSVQSEMSKVNTSTANYTVEAGDNLLAIANRFNVDKSALCAANQVTNENLILAGQILAIPGVTIHKVVSGETLESIAKQSGVNTWELADANKIQSPELITVGQALLIPTSGHSATAWEGGFIHWPVPGCGAITSPFGWREIFGHQEFHQGIDIACPIGTPVMSASNGIVTWVGWENPADHHQGYGYYMIICDKSKLYVYGHLTPSSNLVNTGDAVHAGQTVAKSGDTGDSTGPHLHFGIDLEKVAGGDQWINPLEVVNPQAS